MMLLPSQELIFCRFAICRMMKKRRRRKRRRRRGQ
jgi:hypothetical protein